MSGAEIERTSELLLLQGTHVLSCLAPQAEQDLGLGNQKWQIFPGKRLFTLLCLLDQLLPGFPVLGKDEGTE